MIVDVFFKRGDLSSSNGLYFDVISYDDSFFGEPKVWGTKITEGEYNQLTNEYIKPGVKFGWEGVVNEEGWRKYLKEVQDFG